MGDDSSLYTDDVLPIFPVKILIGFLSEGGHHSLGHSLVLLIYWVFGLENGIDKFKETKEACKREWGVMWLLLLIIK